MQNFSGWFYGETNKLSVGGGLFVGEDGLAANHHFVLSPDQRNFAFQPGNYNVQLHGNVVGRKRTLLLFEADLTVTAEEAEGLKSIESGLHFNWGPESQKYYAHIDKRPERLPPHELLAMIARPEEKITAKEQTK